MTHDGRSDDHELDGVPAIVRYDEHRLRRMTRLARDDDRTSRSMTSVLREGDRTFRSMTDLLGEGDRAPRKREREPRTVTGLLRTAVLAVVAFAAGAAGGTWSSVLIGKARAEVADEIELRVPERGLVFRASSGKALARVRSDVTGGIFEVLDAREQIAVRLRAAQNGGVLELAPSRAPARPALLLVSETGDPGY